MHDPPDLASYDTIIVAFSGGKDSVACVLRLLELGVPRERIELWHHDVDGREGSDLMDWPVTRSYCRAFADALGLRIFYSWKVGGFEREMLRDGEHTQPICWACQPSPLCCLGVLTELWPVPSRSQLRLRPRRAPTSVLFLPPNPSPMPPRSL